jgi:hypothetical protein
MPKLTLLYAVTGITLLNFVNKVNSVDSGKLILGESKEKKNILERNQIDTFILDSVDVGDIKKIKIGHNDKGIGSDWYLEVQTNSSLFYTHCKYRAFPSLMMARTGCSHAANGCLQAKMTRKLKENCFLSPQLVLLLRPPQLLPPLPQLPLQLNLPRLKRIQRKRKKKLRSQQRLLLKNLKKLRLLLILQKRQLLHKVIFLVAMVTNYLDVKYIISVLTGNETGAGTDSKITITLFGDNGDSGNLALLGTKDAFEKYVSHFILINFLGARPMYSTSTSVTSEISRR